VQILIKAGADVSATNIYGNKPLYLAAMYGHDQIVEKYFWNREQRLLALYYPPLLVRSFNSRSSRKKISNQRNKGKDKKETILLLSFF